MASTDSTARPAHPVPPPPLPPPTRRRRRRWPYLLSLVIVILLGLLLFLSWQSGGLAVTGPSGTPAQVACPTETPPFTDCYAETRVSLQPVRAEKASLLRFCCDFIAEWRYSTYATLVLANGAWANQGGFTADLSIDASASVQLSTTKRRLTEPEASGVTVSIVRRPRLTIPLLEPVLRPEWIDRAVATSRFLLAQVPGELDRSFLLEEESIQFTVPAIPRASGDGFVVKQANRPVTRIIATTETRRSLLFSEYLDEATDLSGLGKRLAGAALPTAGALRDRVLAMAATSRPLEVEAGRLEALAAAIGRLDGVVVTKLSKLPEEAERVRDAGDQCLILYEAARAALSRLDAALVTYAVALPTGLLLRPRDSFEHGCGRSEGTSQLDALNTDWRALDLALPRIETALEDNGPPPASKAAGPAAPAVTPAATADIASPGPRDFLLSIASLAKSGTRRAALETSLAETVAVRIGEDFQDRTRGRSDVIRMLRGQWSHAGCWRYTTGPGPGSLTLHIEAQYPYLNHVAFHHEAGGRVTRVEVTGVSYAQLLKLKRSNRGKRCQAFLNPARLADYQLWLTGAGANARTPLDHALRLLRDGQG